MKRILLLLILAATLLAACNQAASLGRVRGFSFSADPANGSVTLQGLSPQALQAFNGANCDVGVRTLVPGQELSLAAYDASFLPGNLLKITASFTNETPYTYQQPLTFSPGPATTNIVASTEPTVADADLGGDGELAPDETTTVLTFTIEHNGQPFTYEVFAEADVLCSAPQPPGSITIRKNVADDSAADTLFDFTFGSTPFSLSENSTGYVVSDLSAGTYTVQETVPSGWALTGIDCGVNNNTATADGVNIVLEAGEDAVCTFNNSRTDILVIKYNDHDQNGTNNELDLSGSTPSGNALTDWTFSLYDSSGTFVTSATTSAGSSDSDTYAEFTNLSPGQTYTLCEEMQPYWISSDPGANSAPDPTEDINGRSRPCKTVTVGTLFYVYFGSFQLG